MRPALVAVSHGTEDPAGTAAVRCLVDAVAARLDAEVRLAHVDVAPPTPLEAMAGLHGPRVIVPLLLSTGYHVRVDLAAASREGGAPVAPAMGPDARLAEALEQRLRGAGWAGGQRVVLVAAGSSDAAAADACGEQASLLAERLGTEVDLAFLTAAEPRAGEVVGRLKESGRTVAIASYLLAPGVFQRKAEALGADLIGPPLLLPDDVPAPLVDLVLDRYASVASWNRLNPA